MTIKNTIVDESDNKLFHEFCVDITVSQQVIKGVKIRNYLCCYLVKKTILNRPLVTVLLVCILGAN